eukprot:CAMPEP_0172362838 /NCGR_PEP_ID=MMETSP1060-20121228/6360_1 /TAXON_ID=37318 /ORGANISM="Pseudo-nitzschia pungens, Strain cf. cingulata" /LENGTH=259 /DNA_ID=CAMNT_0013085437 /DNA_START=122 /DNA_END=901 /DNA_ORIENTATION=+
MATTVNSFVVTSENQLSILQPSFTRELFRDTTPWSYKGRRDSNPLFSSTSTRPLYDGTNYTFPDTQTPAGVAELLEVSFVHACMQLASGYVDVLKMFIAASIAAYEAGFSIASILEELEENKNLPNTANRPLMDEEKKLRRDWLCVVYSTLAAMGYTSSVPSPLAVDVAKKSIPQDISDRYGDYIAIIGEAYKVGTDGLLSAEDVGGCGGNTNELSSIEKAVLLQSLKVATLTPVVVREALEATGNSVKPPTPPIEGAF